MIFAGCALLCLGIVSRDLKMAKQPIPNLCLAAAAVMLAAGAWGLISGVSQ